MTQPRSLNGRFASSGGGDEMPPWAMVLMVVGWFLAAWWLMDWAGVAALTLALMLIFGAVWLVRRFV